MPEHEENISRVEGLLAAEEGAPEPEPKRQPDPAPADISPAQPAEAAPNEGEPTTVEGGEVPPAEGKPTPTEETAQSPEEVEEVHARTISDVAEAFGVDVADLYDVVLPISTPDGSGEITIGEWKDGVQEAARVAHSAQKAQEAAQQQTVELQQQYAAMQQRLTEVNAITQVDEQQLQGEYQKVNWEDLKVNDPAEYAVRRQEFEDRGRAIHARRGQIAQHFQAMQQQAQQQQQQQMHTVQAQELAALTRAIPEWSNPEKASAEKAEIVAYMRGLGYQPQELNNLYDHRAVLMMRKAMMFDRQQQAAPQKKRVVKFGSKVVKPSAPQSKQQTEAEGMRAERTAFRKTGGRDTDLAAAMVEKHFLGDF